MNTTSQNIIIFVAVFAITVAALYGIRSWRMNSAIGEDYALETGLLTEPVRYQGGDYLIPPQDIYDLGKEEDVIQTIKDPDFTNVADADTYLSDEVRGVDVVVAGEHRFYSYQILNWHYIVHDDFNGESLIISHCPLCSSSAVYKAEVNGEKLVFDVENKVYNNNALLKDESTGSLWLQLIGTAISGDMIGSELELYPSSIISWGDWKELYPNGEVLSTETGFQRDYARHPYTNYDTAKTIYFPLNATTDMLGAKWRVTGSVINDQPVAFAHTILKGTGAANEQIGDTSIAAFYNEPTEEVFIVNPVVDGEVLTFSYDFDEKKIFDDQTGSKWLTSGYAYEGELQGTQLERISSKTSFWFCWYAIHPDTIMSEVDLNPEEVDLDAQESDQEEGQSIEIEI